MSQPSGLQKAKIFQKSNTAIEVVCQFNPTELSISRPVSWEPQKTAGKDTPQEQFAGGGANTLTVNLLFDSTDTGSDVRDKYSALHTMAKIEPGKVNQSTGKGEPPEVQFQWGNILLFTGVITSINETLKLFKPDGTPLRATVSVSFKETATSKKGQNPTTYTESRKVWVVHEGQTLDWIAYQEYSDPACWRHIAESNDLANPMDLRPGQVLKLVPLR